MSIAQILCDISNKKKKPKSNPIHMFPGFRICPNPTQSNCAWVFVWTYTERLKTRKFTSTLGLLYRKHLTLKILAHHRILQVVVPFTEERERERKKKEIESLCMKFQKLQGQQTKYTKTGRPKMNQTTPLPHQDERRTTREMYLFSFA